MAKLLFIQLFTQLFIPSFLVLVRLMSRLFVLSFMVILKD